MIMDNIINDTAALKNDIYDLGSTRVTSILDPAKDIQRLLG